jgi:hypothetical protein
VLPDHQRSAVVERRQQIACCSHRLMIPDDPMGFTDITFVALWAFCGDGRVLALTFCGNHSSGDQG